MRTHTKLRRNINKKFVKKNLSLFLLSSPLTQLPPKTREQDENSIQKNKDMWTEKFIIHSSHYLFRMLDVSVDCSSSLPPVDHPHPSLLPSYSFSRSLFSLLPLPSFAYLLLFNSLTSLSPHLLLILPFAFPCSPLCVLHLFTPNLSLPSSSTF